jgi:hypothetical protein
MQVPRKFKQCIYLQEILLKQGWIYVLILVLHADMFLKLVFFQVYSSHCAFI